MGTHNGQGLGIHDGGKLTAIISDGGGSQFGMVGSEWLTRVPIHNNPVAQLVEQHPFKVMVVGSIPTGITMLLQLVTIYFTKTLDIYAYLSLYLSV